MATSYIATRLLSVVGGTPPINYAIVSANIPASLIGANSDTLRVDGSGSSVYDGTYNVNISGTDHSTPPGSVTGSITVNVTGKGGPPSVPTISSFTISPASAVTGTQRTLTWSVTGATSLSIDNGVGVVTGTSTTTSPTATVTYTLTATNSAGSSTLTATATVTVAPVAPVVTGPTNQSVLVGATATFSVTAVNGNSFTYQWRKGGVNIAGATSSSYTTPTLVIGDNGGVYSVVVTNDSSLSTTSADATLTVTASGTAPAITAQPQDDSINENTNLSMSLNATGTAPLTYVWERKPASGSWAVEAGQTTRTYSQTNVPLNWNNSQFRCTVSNSYGTVTSTVATLTVVEVVVDNEPPVIHSLAVSGSGMRSGTVIVTANATDNIGVARVDFYIDGEYWPFGTDYYGSGDDFSASLNTIGYTNGGHYVTAKAYDDAGNEGVWNTHINFESFNDTTKPLVFWVSPTSSVPKSNDVVCTCRATDAVGVASVVYNITSSASHPQPGPVTRFSGTDKDGQYRVSFDFTSYPAGSYEVTIYALDTAGNRSDDNVVTLSIEEGTHSIVVTPATSTIHTNETQVISATWDGSIIAASNYTWSITSGLGTLAIRATDALFTPSDNAGLSIVTVTHKTFENYYDTSEITVQAVADPVEITGINPPILPHYDRSNSDPFVLGTASASGGGASRSFSITGSGFSVGSSTGVISLDPSHTTGTWSFSGVLTCTGNNGTTDSVNITSVEVDIATGSAPVINSFTATPSTVSPNGSSLLAWTITADPPVVLLQLSDGSNTTSVLGSSSINFNNILSTTNFTLTATNLIGSVTSHVTVTVESGPEVVIDNITDLFATGGETLNFDIPYSVTTNTGNPPYTCEMVVSHITDPREIEFTDNSPSMSVNCNWLTINSKYMITATILATVTDSRNRTGTCTFTITVQEEHNFCTCHDDCPTDPYR